MAGNFKRISRILERWPLDESKKGRDLGEHLRNSFKRLYKEGKFDENSQFWDRQYLALQRLINNDHYKKYPRLRNSSATGLSAEECHIALSNEVLELFAKEDLPFYKRMFKKYFCTQMAPELQLQKPHMPVMVTEVLEYLKPEPNQLLLDMTFGAGGHSQELLAAAPGIKLLALDRDPTANSYAKELAKEFPDQVSPLLGRFSELPTLLKDIGIKQNSIDGVLFDFGCSSMQFDNGSRGFSISKNGVLDMRMDANRYPDMPTAADVLATATEEDLYKIIKYYGEEKLARKIARTIVEARYLFKKITTTQELADLVESVSSDENRVDKLQRPAHNATKTFQALRIFVNNELNEINYGLVLAQKYLKIGGRIVTITFHSLEDTIVKRHFTGHLIENAANPLPLKYSSHSLSIDQNIIEEVMESNWKMLHKHVIIPKYEEIENNPRSRSAKLRAAVRIK